MQKTSSVSPDPSRRESKSHAYPPHPSAKACCMAISVALGSISGDVARFSEGKWQRKSLEDPLPIVALDDQRRGSVALLRHFEGKPF
jgi:hypothetical protein